MFSFDTLLKIPSFKQLLRKMNGALKVHNFPRRLKKKLPYHESQPTPYHETGGNKHPPTTRVQISIEGCKIWDSGPRFTFFV